MAVFPSFKLTKKGEELLNRSIGEGKVLTFTKFEIGDGNPPIDFREQTSLVNKFYQFPVLSTDIQKNQILRIKGYFDNKSFTGDKQLKEIGVFVKIQNDETEYLYSYTNAGESGDIIPGNTRGFYSRTLDVANYIGYATNITFNIEQLRDRYAFNTENEMKVASYLKAGDKVELWGNLVLGDKPTDEYIIQESGEIKLNNGLFAKKVSFKYIAQTIDEMKKLALKVGDVVEVLGYYTVGDGANHKRIIEEDKGLFGVPISNGLYANIITNGELDLLWIGIEVEKLYDWYDNIDFSKARRNWEKLNELSQYINTTYMSKPFSKIIIPRGDIIIDKTLHFIRPNASGSGFSIVGMGGGHSAFGLNGSTLVCVRRDNFDSEPVGVIFTGMNSSNLKDFCIISKSSKVGKFNGVKISCVVERDKTWKYAQLNRYDNVSFINACKLYRSDYSTEIDYTTLNNGLGQIGLYSNKQEASTFINCTFDAGEHGSGLVGTVTNYCNVNSGETFDEDVYSGYSSANNIFLQCLAYGGVAPIVLDGCWNWNFKGYLNCYNIPSSNVLKLVGKGSHTIKLDEMQVEQSHTFLGIDTRDDTSWYTYNIKVANGTFFLPKNSDVVKIYPNCDTKVIKELDFSEASYNGNFNSFLTDLRPTKCYIKNVKFKDETENSYLKIIDNPNGQIENLKFETYKFNFDMGDLKDKITGDYERLELTSQKIKISEDLTINQNKDSTWNIIVTSNIEIRNQNEQIVYDNEVSSRGYQSYLTVYEIGSALFCELVVYIPDTQDTKLHLEIKDLSFTDETKFRYANYVMFPNGEIRPSSFSGGKLHFDLCGSIGWARLNFISNGKITKNNK